MAWKRVTVAVPYCDSTEGDSCGKDNLVNSNPFPVKSECVGIVLYFSDKQDSDLLFKNITYSEDRLKNKNSFYPVLVVSPLFRWNHCKQFIMNLSKSILYSFI